MNNQEKILKKIITEEFETFLSDYGAKTANLKEEAGAAKPKDINLQWGEKIFSSWKFFYSFVRYCFREDAHPSLVHMVSEDPTCKKKIQKIH